MEIITKNTRQRTPGTQLIQMAEWEIFTMSRMDKGRISRIYKEFLYLNQNKTSAIKEKYEQEIYKTGNPKS